MDCKRRSTLLTVAGAIIALKGLVIGIGGIWLIALGGSWYYFIIGLAFILTAYLLFIRQSWALVVYALIVLGTLVWAVWESGLDWWPLAARGDVIFLLGLFLLTPFITRRLGPRQSLYARQDEVRPVSALRGAGLALTGSLVIALAVGIVSLFFDHTRIEGEAPDARVQLPTDARGVPAGEWHAYGRSAFGQRYSPLAQLTPDNVGGLEVAWTYRTGDLRGKPGDPVETTFQVTPLKIGDRLFLCTPHQSVIALEADTGKEIWRYNPKVQGELALQHLTCRGLSYHAGGGVTVAPAEQAPLNQGPAPEGQPVAINDGKASESCPAKLFMPTADGRLIAINPDNGHVCADFGGGDGQIDLWSRMPNVNPGSYYSTSPVVVTQNLIIVGGTVLDNVSVNEASGVIRAYDVNTGALVWNWDSGNPEATQPLAEGQTYTPNSPNSWSISSVDEELGMVYIPMGNQPPDQWGGNRSDNVGKFSSSVVALDLSTGQVRWVFQTVHHDLWDYDVPSQPSLINLIINGESVPALVQSTKQGELYVLDRRSGKPVLPVTEKAAPQGAAEGDKTAPTQPVSEISYDPKPLTGADMWGATMFDQMLCRIQLKSLRYEGRYTPPSEEGSLIYPGNFGVFNWGGVAVDPERQIAFTTPTYLAFVSQLVRREDDKTLYVQDGRTEEGALPALNENFGAPFAARLKPFTSLLGLPCQQPPWGFVSAADLTTGKILWKHKNGTVRDASPLPLPFAMGVPNLGGPIMTKGGVAFLSGAIDNYVRAYDVKDGSQLWESRLPAGGQATPMTYLGADGRQYLLVVAGGHGSLGTTPGDYVIAYALPR